MIFLHGLFFNKNKFRLAKNGNLFGNNFIKKKQNVEPPGPILLPRVYIVEESKLNNVAKKLKFEVFFITLSGL